MTDASLTAASSSPWLDARLAARIADKFGTPAYVYSRTVLDARCNEIREAFPRAHIRYAMKANASRAILAIVRAHGFGIDAVSPWEVRLARECGFAASEILYTGHGPSDDELGHVAQSGVTANLDSLSALARFGRRAPGARVALRVNLDLGAGHHPHVITAGPESKFGLDPSDLDEARLIAARNGVVIAGLHQHVGSGLFERDVFVEAARRLFAIAGTFPDLAFVDVGGGFGVPYRPGESRPDLRDWNAGLTPELARLSARLQRDVQLVIEPGRYLVAECGVLLARVACVKPARDRVFVGLDTGMHHLVRPAMYGSFHPIEPLVERESAPARCFFTGPICESGDVMGEERSMPVPHEGDLVKIGCAGAYGYAMASHYNLRPRPPEIVVDGVRVRRVRARERYRDLVG